MHGITIRWLTLTFAIIVTSYLVDGIQVLSLIHISEPTRQVLVSRMPSSA